MSVMSVFLWWWLVVSIIGVVSINTYVSWKVALGVPQDESLRLFGSAASILAPVTVMILLIGGACLAFHMAVSGIALRYRVHVKWRVWREAEIKRLADEARYAVENGPHR